MRTMQRRHHNHCSCHLVQRRPTRPRHRDEIPTLATLGDLHVKLSCKSVSLQP
jgi:hypothetical protein